MHVARLGLALLAGGCGGGAETAGLDPDPDPPGAVVVSIDGLPAGGAAALSLTGPNGYQRSIAGPETVTGLVAGSYALAASDVVVDGDGFAASPSSQGVAVRSGGTAPVSVGYAITTGRLAITVSGVPAGAAAIAVRRPDGSTSTLTGAATLTGLAPGDYVVTAGAVTIDGDHFAAGDSIRVTVAAGSSAVPVAVEYQQVSGRLDLSVTDVPVGATAAIEVEGPDGFATTVTGSASVRGLAPGSYRIGGAELVVDGDRYEVVATPANVVVSAGSSPASAVVKYRIRTGALAVSVSGLPAGTPASVTITGPGGFTTGLTGGGTLRGLLPGSYTVAAAAGTSGGSTWVAQPVSQVVTVSAGGAPAPASVGYTLGTGGLSISVSGLPGATPAAIVVNGPGGFTAAVSATTTLTGLAPGGYTIAASAVTSGIQTYQPAPTSQNVVVALSQTAAASVSYSATTGSLSITVSGLPGAAAAGVTVTGPGGYNRIVAATETLTGLVAGSYAIAAANVTSGGIVYRPTPTSQTAAVTAGGSTAKTVSYAATGTLAVTISGLPGGANASVTVTGPGGFTRSLTASQTLTGLTAGSYTVAAASVSSGGTWVPTAGSQSVAVTAGAIAAASVSYAAGPAATLDLTIDGMYLTQAVAKYDGTTPVIAGRDAILRVFVVANQANTATPAVRVRFYSGAALVQTSTIPAAGGSVPTAVTEGTYASSWNLAVPASLVQANLRILADVDPTGAVAEASDANNAFPVTGTPFAVDVRTVPTWNVRFVPVLQQANGLQGNVTAGNMATFLVDPLKLLPIGAYDADLRAVYTTTAPVLQSGNGNGAWGTILNEVLALKSTDASTRYYYGVVKTSYGGGVAGIGYVGGGVNASIGWDNLPSGSGVMAHEVGHNMSRPHAPCGGVANPDPGYPYAGGSIGVYGLDPITLAVKSPASFSDLMSYCHPEWVSDYNWGKMITYRQGGPLNAPPSSGAAVAGLLVWGRITANGVVLEPAFRVAAPAALQSGTAGYSVEVLGADGRVLRSAPVDLIATSAEAGFERHFAVVVPLDPAADAGHARVRLVTPTGPIERVSAQPPVSGRLFLRDPAGSVARTGAVQARFSWDGASYPMAMIRDAGGRVISFARGGSATVWTASPQFDVTFSDGVRSVTRRIR